MSIELAERLKREFTDKWVVVQSGVPELRRFEGLTGRVKTVNMNCRALVEFDNPVDISWYDIDPSFLSVVDEPKPKPKAEPKAEKKEAPAKAEGKPAAKTAGLSPLELARQQAAGGAKPATEKKGALSPLEMARQQGAAGGAKADAAPKAAPKQEAPSGKALSPLEMARMQGGGGGAKSEAAPAAPKAEPKAAPGGKALSPLEMARMQGAGGAKAAAETEIPAKKVAEAQTAAPEPAPAKPAAAEDDDANLSPLERARKQGALKKKD
ncbi:MAG TPA: hypothetical protein VMM56_02330 [Planctomycetaceae bacterium]|nr:hypothetical protein [Planctomycetaceae bacterium]